MLDMKIEKKQYETPFAKLVEIYLPSIMTTGSIIDGDIDDEYDEPIMDPDNQNVGTNRGDWENIWGNM